MVLPNPVSRYPLIRWGGPRARHHTTHPSEGLGLRGLRERAVGREIKKHKARTCCPFPASLMGAIDVWGSQFQSLLSA